MKKILKISIAVSTVILAGCLDDDKYALDPSGTENIIEFTDITPPSSPLNAVHPLYVTSFPVSEEDEFDIIVSYSGPDSNNKNIELTLEVDPFVLAAYNQQQQLASATYKPYLLLPPANYSISSMTVTIPKGETKATVPVTVFPDAFDLSKNYAIPLRIVATSDGTLSSVYSAALFATVVKNKYDGVYTVTAYRDLPDEYGMDDVTNAAFEGIYEKVVELRTVNGNTVKYFDQEYNLAGHVFYTGTGASYYGNFYAQLEFNETTNVVTALVNGLGQGTGSRWGSLDPGGSFDFDFDDDGVLEDNADPMLDEVDIVAPQPVMTFEADGVTPKTLSIWYIMSQPNAATNRTFWKETYTYVEPRP